MFLPFFKCGQPRTWRPGHASDYEQSHSTSRARVRGERRSCEERGRKPRAPQSLHLKTINLHNFTFSLAVRGSCGLGLPRRGTGRHDTQSIKRLRAELTANSKRQIQVENFLKWSIWADKNTPKQFLAMCSLSTYTRWLIFLFVVRSFRKHWRVHENERRARERKLKNVSRHPWEKKRFTKSHNGSFSNDDGGNNENGRKAKSLISKTTTLHVYHTFL